MRNHERSGVTVLEALFVALILSIVLSATAYTLRGYARATVQSSTKDRVMAGAHAALEIIRSDVAAAYTLKTNSSNPRLLIQRVDPAEVDRVHSVSSAQRWEPFGTEHLAEVRYEVSDQRLLRIVTPPGGSASSQVLAGDILYFQCYATGRGRYDVSISFEEATKKTVINSIAVRRVRQEPELKS